MAIYSCLCGSKTTVSDLEPPHCQYCEECGTTLAKDPRLCTEPKSHMWRLLYNPFDGKMYSGCHMCGAKKSER